MNARHLRILGIIADLEHEQDGREIDEFSIAQACGAIPEALPRHAWVKHPSRGELLQLFTALDQAGLIYVTRRGYWGFHLTQRGREVLATTPHFATRPADEPKAETIVGPTPLPLPVWEGPRPSNLPFTPRNDHFYSTMALAVAALGALLILAFGQSSFSPLARDSAAAADASPTLAVSLPPTSTPLEEIGPERNVNGVLWRLVRAPDGTEGYVPAQFVEEVQ